MGILREAPLAIGIEDIQAGASDKCGNDSLPNPPSLGGPLYGKQVLFRLRRSGFAGRHCQTKYQDQTGHRFKYQPHRTEPPFTLRTSPVIKVAKSQARNRIGPAISSGVAGRPSGIWVCTSFTPAFVWSTGFDMSVSTHPGATQLTSTR